MKRSYRLKSSRVLALVALFGAMITTMLSPAYAQQEVDPTWYNPWVSSSSTASTAAVQTTQMQTTQPKAAEQVRKAKIKTVSRHAANNASKRVVTQTKPS